MNRRAFFRTVAAAAVVAPVVQIPAPALAPSRLCLSGLCLSGFVSDAWIAKRTSKRFTNCFDDYKDVAPYAWPVPSKRLTLADIRGYGPPERLPA